MRSAPRMNRTEPPSSVAQATPGSSTARRTSASVASDRGRTVMAPEISAGALRAVRHAYHGRAWIGSPTNSGAPACSRSTPTACPPSRPEVDLRARIGAVMRNSVTQNAVALYASQFLLTIVPLITLPWIARALGAAELGEVVFVQSFGWVLAAIGEYGFRFSGTRAIARVRDDPERLAGTVADIMGAKLLLTGVVTVIALLALVTVSRFREDPVLLLYGWLLGVSQGFDPLWYFAGVERLRLTAAMEAAVRLLTAAAIIALVHDPGQGNVVLAIWACGLALSSFGLIAVMYRAVPLRRPSLHGARAALREGWALFVNSAAITLYTAATVFLLGFVATNPQLAIFGAAERIVRAGLRTLSPVTSAAFPRVTYLLEAGREDRAQRLSTIATGALVAFGAAAGGGLFLLAPFIVDLLLGPGYERSV